MRNNIPETDDVIIIDDDREVSSILEMYLEEMGLFRNVISARDGSEASKKLLNQKFACILLDINMPKKSGVNIIKEFHKGKGNTLESVIVISGGLDKAIMGEAMKSGVRHFLVKPFNEEVFIKKVKSVLAKVRPDLLKAK